MAKTKKYKIYLLINGSVVYARDINADQVIIQAESIGFMFNEDVIAVYPSQSTIVLLDEAKEQPVKL